MGDKKVDEKSKEEPIFEVPEVVVGDVVALPTVKDLTDKGWDAREIAMAKAGGQVLDEKDVPDAGADKGKTEGAPKGKEGDAGADDTDKGADAGKADAAKPKGDEEPWKITPEEEAKLKEVFGPDHKLTGVYFRMRSETKKRQKAAAQAEELRVNLEQAQAQNKDLTSLVEKLKAAVVAGGGKPKGDEGDEDPLEALLKGDADKSGADAGKGKDKPLTVKDLEEREAAKLEAAKKVEVDRTNQQKRLGVRLDTFRADAQEKFDDYDEAETLAEEVIADLKKKEDGELFKGDPDKRELAEDRARKFLIATVNALSWKEGDETPAELFYKLGKMHPKYKKVSGKPETDVPAGDDGKVDRMLKNAGKRSSAGVGGGGSPRGVSEKELTVEQFMALPKADQDRVSDATRKRLLQA
jgi:hypothetical protein